MKMRPGVIGSLMCISTSVWATTAPVCVKTDRLQIEGLFEQWNTALQSGEARKVANTYLDDAVLLPTLSNKMRLTNAERVDYFRHFLAKRPVGNIKSRTIRLGCNTAIDTGIYAFTFADKSTVSARYTFTYAWDGDEWKISTHHSSVMPES
ncbi:MULTISPECIES: SgcJ/EcaC family oxidoreductase [Serratia]|uniref:SgcJ/EcaC family oxidoreductase n=1 Tax=Serratia TaxID=613 RepID=UPI00074567D0|nr:SgcJ/EcaC family oxidoreductase [Serratia marcescens]EJD6707284.1 SgcJ/EcaC family oxidoreductase [Serratia marcescens]ELH4209545.1 SgcJ/EcaC family oxidoreductase [Serratia marcescens]EME1466210.1 SgcJ/EcaC family oxidoreductase [Serratia marcescens]MBH2570459.1 SgcJ/EcaC family oxidoreductase [Serratia marcescens]MDS0825594.1 SgcJ/EcaC family oxidoreductase [Serratia marcescens]